MVRRQPFGGVMSVVAPDSAVTDQRLEQVLMRSYIQLLRSLPRASNFEDLSDADLPASH
jgi:hypothetical protein